MLPAATVSEHDGVRYLHLDSPWVQGAMCIARPQRIELDYVQRMLASLLWLPQHELGAGRAVQLGLGAGALTRFTLGALRMHTTVVEINPQVVSACRAWFRLPDDGERLQVHLGDAAAWLQGAAPGSTQLLHVDLYDHDAAAPVLDDEAFYADCRALLAEGGVMAVNLFGRHASYERSAARIAVAFGADQMWRLQATREGNTVVVAGRGAVVPGRDELAARATNIEQRFLARHGLPARKWLRMVKPYQPA
ncbi:MAG TPA: spermidine synthase [Rubrivivax sp.]